MSSSKSNPLLGRGQKHRTLQHTMYLCSTSFFGLPWRVYTLPYHVLARPLQLRACDALSAARRPRVVAMYARATIAQRLGWSCRSSTGSCDRIRGYCTRVCVGKIHEAGEVMVSIGRWSAAGADTDRRSEMRGKALPQHSPRRLGYLGVI